MVWRPDWVISISMLNKGRDTYDDITVDKKVGRERGRGRRRKTFYLSTRVLIPICNHLTSIHSVAVGKPMLIMLGDGEAWWMRFLCGLILPV